MRITARKWEQVEALNLVSKEHYLNVNNTVSYHHFFEKWTIEEFESIFSELYTYKKSINGLFTDFEVIGLVAYNFSQHFK